MKKLVIMLLWIVVSVFIFSWIFSEVKAQWEVKHGGDAWGQVTPGEKAENIWLNLGGDCLTWMWVWCFDYEKMIWISNEQNEDIDALSLAQDVMLSATYMVWTVLTIVIIYCGLWYIFASRDGKDVSKYKKWLITAAIWALLVRWAYAIVRLIQFIAKW
jgi:hypothetical protein